MRTIRAMAICNYRMRWLPVVSIMLFCILFLGAVRSGAQTPDILLSEKPIEPILPKEAQIQSIARIDRKHLVVWGTTEHRAREGVFNVLVMQMLVDSLPLGQPVRMTSLAARPYRFVQVVPIGDRFIVVWNDRRSIDSGAYARVIGIDGGMEGEWRMWDRGIGAQGIVAIPIPAGWKLLWSDARGTDSIYSCELAADGSLAKNSAMIADGRVRGVIHPVALPGYTIIDRAPLSPLLLDGKGVVQSFSAVAAAKFARAYHLGDDGSVATIEGRTAKFFQTLADDAPSRVVQVPLPDGFVAGSETIFRDTLGILQICYAKGGGSAWGPHQGISTGIYRISEVAPGHFGKASSIGSVVLYWVISAHETASATPANGWTERGPDNSYRIHIRLAFSWTSSRQGITRSGEGIDTVVYSIKNSRISYVPTPAYARLEPGGPVFRVPSTTASIVDVIAAGHRIRLTAPVHFDRADVPQIHPAIHTLGDTLLVGWLSFGVDTTAALAQWGPGAPGIVAALPRLRVNGGLEEDQLRLDQKVYHTMMCMGGRMLAGISDRWSTLDNSDRTSWRGRYRLYAPSPRGWQEVMGLDFTHPDSTVASTGYSTDPERREMLVTFDRRDGNARSVGAIAFDSSGGIAWRIDSFRVGGYWKTTPVAMGRETFIFVEDITTGRVTRDGYKLLAGTGMPIGAVYLPMLGSRYLRAYVNNVLMLDLFDSNAIVVADTSVLAVRSAIDLFMVQNPGDSGVAILYGGNGGVKMVTLDRNLKILDGPTTISATRDSVRRPVAAFKGDSLYVAWEDYRNGTPDIYGTVVVPRTHGVARERREDIDD